jgi:hypothetical protein
MVDGGMTTNLMARFSLTYLAPPNRNYVMKILNLVAGAAFVLLTSGLQAQSCSGHAKAAAPGDDGMSMLARELNLTAEQQKSVSAALDACHKDCADMASASTSPEQLSEKKMARFSTAVEAMKASLKPEQVQKLDELNKAGKLSGLCSADAKSGCCAGKAAKSGGCCAGKAGAHSEHKPAKAPETGATPSIQ